MCEKPCGEWANSDCRFAALLPDKKIHGLLVMKNDEYEIRPIDVVFPVLHGKSGEDGAIQGLLELSGVPYVGCDIQSSAICMDKSLTYVVVKNADIATPDFMIVNNGDRPDSHHLSYPVFVKPARSGSSFGVTKVDSGHELAAAIETARKYDSKVLIEKAVSGIEVGCAVLGNAPDLLVGEVDQITLSHGIFRIHQEAAPEKGSENARITVPAALPQGERKRLQETAKAIYQALGCRGLARVDMFLQENGDIVLNEVNTLPGFTSYSRYPRMMAAAGITLAELIDRLIMLARKE
jgi:D-alanine--(R)-lactate ligase